MNTNFVYVIDIFSSITVGPIRRVRPGASENLEPALVSLDPSQNIFSYYIKLLLYMLA
jgi:hypothetical protein